MRRRRRSFLEGQAKGLVVKEPLETERAEGVATVKPPCVVVGQATHLTHQVIHCCSVLNSWWYFQVISLYFNAKTSFDLSFCVSLNIVHNT